MTYKNIIDVIIHQNKKLNSNNESLEFEENDVTELQMHKILFFVYGAFYKKFKLQLWDANFYAWKYGPVEINFRSANQEEIAKHFSIKETLTDEQIEYLNYLINKFLRMSVWRLVDFSHTLNCWLKNHNTSSKINNEDIQQDFVSIEI